MNGFCKKQECPTCKFMQLQALYKADWARQLRVDTSKEKYALADKHSWPFMIDSKVRDLGNTTKGEFYHISE